MAASEARVDWQAGRFAVLVDVRREEEWNAGHIRNATFMPSLQETRELTALRACKSCRIAVYCRSGRRSKQAAEVLDSAGFESVIDVEGVQQWTAAGEQLVNDASREPACSDCTSNKDDRTNGNMLVIVASALGSAAVLTAIVAGLMCMRRGKKGA